MGTVIAALVAALWTWLAYEMGRVDGQQEMLDEFKQWEEEGEALLRELMEEDE